MTLSFVQNLLRRFQSPEVVARKTTAEAMYDVVGITARQPQLYLDLGIPDSFDGRFDCLVLFAALVLRRMKQIEGEKSPLGRDFATLFISDMDRTVRELGVGDLGVGKHVKNMAEAFYGRLEAYDHALAGEENLKQTLHRNLYGGGEVSDDQLGALESYILDLVEQLDQKGVEDFLADDEFSLAPFSPETTRRQK